MVDYPRLCHVYKDCPHRGHYGGGFGVAHKLTDMLGEKDRDPVSEPVWRGAHPHEPG